MIFGKASAHAREVLTEAIQVAEAFYAESARLEKQEQDPLHSLSQGDFVLDQMFEQYA